MKKTFFALTFFITINIFAQVKNNSSSILEVVRKELPIEFFTIAQQKPIFIKNINELKELCNRDFAGNTKTVELNEDIIKTELEFFKANAYCFFSISTHCGYPLIKDNKAIIYSNKIQVITEFIREEGYTECPGAIYNQLYAVVIPKNKLPKKGKLKFEVKHIDSLIKIPVRFAEMRQDLDISRLNKWEGGYDYDKFAHFNICFNSGSNCLPILEKLTYEIKDNTILLNGNFSPNLICSKDDAMKIVSVGINKEMYPNYKDMKIVYLANKEYYYNFELKQVLKK